MIRKEALQIARDPSAIAIAFALPLILLFIFGYGISLDSGRIKAGIVLESPDEASRSLLASFSGSRFFDVRTGTDLRLFEADLMRRRLSAIVVIPAGFTRDLAGGKAMPIQVITDGTESNAAHFALAYSLGAVEGWALREAALQGAAAGPLIDVVPRFRYNPELSSRNFIIPGSLSIVMTLIGVLLTALVVAREWERGTMESLLSTPVTVNQVILAKMATYYILAIVSVLICLAVAAFWYKVPFRGSVAALLAMSTVFLASALGQGLLISALARDQYLASQAALVSGFLPSFFLSGFVFELASMPEPIQAVSRLVAARYFVGSLQTVFLVGDVWPLFLKSMGAMAVIGLAFFLLTSRKLVKRVA
ncbi:MAG: ABC transporter permease [Deltaproteobacteria bacterium]|nr:ABC transporter permease [Deltaproteobacteria bacterium]